MPELPEVACVGLSLERLLLRRSIRAVRIDRRDIITGPTHAGALLVGDTVASVLRHGKQLAIVGSKGGCVSVHLGMSGQLCVMESEATVKKRSPARDCLENEIKKTASKQQSAAWPAAVPPHTHVLWQFDDGLALRFTDPRRFGGLWTFDSQNQLVAQRWSKLGPDALSITPRQLARGLSQTQRALKAALLDQHLVAGLGNIYVDELLFNAKLHPLTPAKDLPAAKLPGLVGRMRTLLRGAIQRGGSSLRDYVDAENQRGSQQHRHRVYGRSGQRCKRRGCAGVVAAERVAGRTTAWCPCCQVLPQRVASPVGRCVTDSSHANPGDPR